jgi:molecular chaperone GrpE
MDNENKVTEHADVEGLSPEGGTPNSSVEEGLNEAEALANAPLPNKEELEQLRAEAAKAKENWDKFLRTAADFENYKKRVAREKQDLTRYANESILQKLVPILDNFESALLSTGKAPAASADSMQTGIQMIHQQLKAALTDAGLEEIDAANKPFDPNWHEALSQQERADVPEGQVVQQVRKGYKLRERLLRPAAVIVSKLPHGK